MRRPRLIIALSLAVLVALIALAYAARPAASSQKVGTVATGKFHRLAHQTTGRATLVRRADDSLELRMRGFRTHPAPDLFVYLFRGTERTSISQGTKVAPLRTTLGDQRYIVPRSFEAEGVVTVVIWCAKCQTENGAAELEPV